MKTNTKRRIIATAALLLFAIGAGYLYINHERTLNNGQDKTVTTSPMSENPASIARSPVITPTTAATASLDNNQKKNSESKALATNFKHRRHHSKNGNNKDELIGLNTTRNYEGNLPVAVATKNDEEKTKVPPVQNTVPISVQQIKERQNKNRKSGSINFAPEIGANINGLNHNNTSNLYTYGFHAGVMMNIGLNDAFALQPGLRYIQKGNEEKRVSSANIAEVSLPMEVNTTRKTMLEYIELPLNLVYKFGGEKGTSRFMIGAGPYVSYLVNAKDNIKSTTTNDEGFVVNTKNYTTTTTANMKKLDYGIGGFIGCQAAKGFYAKGGAELGLRDIVQDPVNGNSDRNFNFMISVGYILGSKAKVY